MLAAQWALSSDCDVAPNDACAAGAFPVPHFGARLAGLMVFFSAVEAFALAAAPSAGGRIRPRDIGARGHRSV
jgi:hypothetical protein